MVAIHLPYETLLQSLFKMTEIVIVRNGFKIISWLSAVVFSVVQQLVQDAAFRRGFDPGGWVGSYRAFEQVFNPIRMGACKV